MRRYAEDADRAARPPRPRVVEGRGRPARAGVARPAGTRSRASAPADDPLPRRDVNVLVTGGSRGIGRAIALRFARDGARRVAIGYLRNDRAAEETAERASCRRRGARARPGQRHLGPGRSRRSRRSGRSTSLVHNAATGVIRPALETEDKHWDWTLNANARALLSLARVVAPSMPQGSSIVALSSLGAQRVLENYVLVGTSKAALESLVRYLAVELAPRGIRVNAVSGGVVETGALEHFPNKEEMLRVGSREPGRPARVARRHGRSGRVPLLARRRHGARPDARRRRRVLAARRTSREPGLNFGRGGQEPSRGHRRQPHHHRRRRDPRVRGQPERWTPRSIRTPPAGSS